MRSLLLALLLCAAPLRAAAPVPEAITISWYWETGKEMSDKVNHINDLLVKGWTITSVQLSAPGIKSFILVLTPPKTP